MRRHILVCLVIVATSAAGLADDPTPEQLLLRYAAALKLPEHVAFDAVREQESGAERRIHELRVRRDGERWEMTQKSNLLRNGEPVVLGGRAEPERFQRLVVTGDREVAFTRQPPGSTQPSLILRDDGQGAQRIAAMLDGSLMCFELPWSYENVHLLAAECTLKVRPQPETVNGHACRVLEITGRYGTATLWLDAAVDGLPRRTAWTRGPDDALTGSDSTQREPPGRQVRGVERRREATAEVRRIERVRGQYMVTEATSTMLMSENGKVTQRWTSTLRLTDIDARPDFRGTDTFTLEYPDGMLAGVVSGSTLDTNYIWQAGRVVRLTPGEMQKRLDGLRRAVK